MTDAYTAIGYAFAWTLAVGGVALVACMLFGFGKDVLRSARQFFRSFR